MGVYFGGKSFWECIFQYYILFIILFIIIIYIILFYYIYYILFYFILYYIHIFHYTYVICMSAHVILLQKYYVSPIFIKIMI